MVARIRLVGFSAFIASALLAAAGAPQAQTRIAPHSVIEFASVEQGRMILGAVDDYVSRMSSFDRMLRLKSTRVISEREFLDFSMDSVLPWTLDERSRIDTVIAPLAEELRKLGVSFPARVLLVKTSGRAEEGLAHTRANAIMLSQRSLGASDEALASLLAHELFHVLTRHDPALRARAYRVIGFHVGAAIALPERLAAIRITNPDAPADDAFIEIAVDGNPAMALPLLLSRSPVFDPAIGRDIGDYWELKLLILEAADTNNRLRPLLRDAGPVLLAISEVSGFFEQVGRNTDYIIHPEEILAENFALMLTGGKARNPDLIRRIRELFDPRVESSVSSIRAGSIGQTMFSWHLPRGCRVP